MIETFVPGLVICPASDSIGVTVPGLAGLDAVLPPPNSSSPGGMTLLDGYQSRHGVREEPGLARHHDVAVHPRHAARFGRGLAVRAHR